jgi:hypothetical protein
MMGYDLSYPIKVNWGQSEFKFDLEKYISYSNILSVKNSFLSNNEPINTYNVIPKISFSSKLFNSNIINMPSNWGDIYTNKITNEELQQSNINLKILLTKKLLTDLDTSNSYFINNPELNNNLNNVDSSGYNTNFLYNEDSSGYNTNLNNVDSSGYNTNLNNVDSSGYKTNLNNTDPSGNNTYSLHKLHPYMIHSPTLHSPTAHSSILQSYSTTYIPTLYSPLFNPTTTTLFPSLNSTTTPTQNTTLFPSLNSTTTPTQNTTVLSPLILSTLFTDFQN